MEQGDLVRVRVRAKNSEGYGAYSNVNVVGVRMRSVPAKMTLKVVGKAKD